MLLLLLQGCAPLQRVDAPVAAIAPLPENWDCEGKMSLRGTTPEGATTSHLLRFSLAQRGEKFSLRLSGSLGMGAVLIDGTPGLVTLRRGDQVVEQAEHSEALLYQLTGLQLPVSLLRYWLGGRPGPASIAPVSQRSEQGFEQAGWSVHYPVLADFDGLTLPRKLRASGAPGSITAVISHWQPNPEADPGRSAARP